MFPSTFDAAAHARRRAALSERLGDTPALLAAGKLRARNYAANAYPFRAASHFLYLFGLACAEAMGLWDGRAWTLFLEEPGPDDALWEGALPPFGELAERTGVAVRGRSALPDALAPLRGTATLPLPDGAGCAELSALLGRPVRYGALGGPPDERLADAMVALRLHHDEAAVAELRAAADITCAMHRAGLRATRPGAQEAAVRAEMEAQALARGVALAYQPIVTVRGEVLHNQRQRHVLEAGQLLLADVGAESPGGWAADVTRTWPVGGSFSDTQRELYEVVLRAQGAVLAAARPGVRFLELHRLAQRELARGLVALGILRGDAEERAHDGTLALLFPHGVGHLLGLDVHDMEDLGDRAGYAPGRTRSAEFGLRHLRLDRDLEPGMAFTVEPGLYLVPAILDDPRLGGAAGDRLDRVRLAHFADVRGIRIEDDVLVTTEGCEVLTAAIPKGLAALEVAMAAG